MTCRARSHCTHRCQTADAYFNQDAEALKALLADNVVQHAGKWVNAQSTPCAGR